jgi:alcohol dehydrogenase
MKDIGKFTYFLPTKIIFGVGTIDQVGTLVKPLGRKALVVTGGKSAKSTGLLDKVVKELDETGISHILFDRIVPNPLTTTVDDGAKIAKDEKCDFVIGIGGGSPIDSAKMISAVAKSGGKCWDYTNVGGGRVPKEALPMVAIPTTHGTGTEADPFAVITNPQTHEKIGVGFDSIFPKISIVDPGVMRSLPPNQTASTGMDAFYHAIESYVNMNHQPASDLLALEAISLINQYLPIAYKDGENIEARKALAWASTAAGICETLSGCIANHSLEHPLSGYYNITHGVGLCATGPTLFEYILPYVKERLAKVAAVMGAPENLTDVEELAKLSIELLKRLQRSVDLDVSLSKIGVERSKIKPLAADAMRTMGGLVEVTPGNLKVEDLEKIYERSF